MCALPTRACASARRPRATAISTFPDRCGLRDHRRRRRASGLRLPVGERQVRRYPRCPRHHLHRPVAEHIRIMGDKITAKKTAKRLWAFRWFRDPRASITTDEDAREDRQGNRLSGDHQGDRRRRRPRHEGGQQRGRTLDGAVDRALRSQGRVRQRPSTSRSISGAPPYRDAGSRRRRGQRGPSGRARLFAAAPPPEGLGRSALASLNEDQRMEIGEICAKAMRELAIAARARSSFSTRTASSTSSR
jgi:hypothetical protein